MRVSVLVIALSGLLGFVGAGHALAQAADHPDLSGAWISQSSPDMKVTIDEKDGRVHIREFKGTELKSEYECTVNGKDCTPQGDHHIEKVSFWYNGPMLVELETGHNLATKRRYQLADGGKSLEVEVMPILPEGKAEKSTFTRQEEASR